MPTVATALKRTVLSALGQRTEEPPISWLMDLALARPRLISLAAGFTDNATLPVRDTRRLLAGLLRTRASGAPALQYGTTAGLPELRRLTVEHLRQLDAAALAVNAGAGAELDNALYAPEQLLITNGSQQLLYLLSEVLCDPGDIVLVEDPTYFVFLGIAQSHGLRCRGIPLAADGLDLAALEQTLETLKVAGELPRVKLLYLISYFQNPTSTTTNLANKAAALALVRRYERAAGHPIYLVEDAAYRELRFAGADVPSALTLPGAAERVVYSSTFSKPFATGVRIGYGRLPAALLTPVMRVKGNHDFGSASLLQHLLARALADGTYEQHLAVLRRRYARKAAAMVAALREHFPAGVAWREPRGGLYVWAKLPARQRTGMKSPLLRRALERDVLYVPGRLCYTDDPTRRAPDDEMRLSFGNASLAEIATGIARLGGVVSASI